MIKRWFGLLIISICIFSLSFHFIVEGLGGVHDHLIGRQVSSIPHSHDGDQFLLSEPGGGKFVQAISQIPITSNLHQISRPLPPPFHPPKSF